MNVGNSLPENVDKKYENRKNQAQKLTDEKKIP